MGKPIDAEKAKFIEYWGARQQAVLDDNGRWVREEPLTGDRLRERIDALDIPYTRMALWLGLSIDGLQKQMRGDRPVTAQTSLLFHAVEASLRHTKLVGEAIGSDTDPQRWKARLKQLERDFQRERRHPSTVAHRHRDGPPE